MEISFGPEDGILQHVIPAVFLAPVTWVGAAGGLVIADSIGTTNKFSDIPSLFWNIPRELWAKAPEASIITAASIIAAGVQDFVLPKSAQFDTDPNLSLAVDGVYVGICSFPLFWMFSPNASTPLKNAIMAGIVYGGGILFLANVHLVRDTINKMRGV